MDSKFIILLAFASLAQAHHVPTLNVTFGLSKEQVAEYNKIVVNQDDAQTTYREVIRSFFNEFSEPEARAPSAGKRVYQRFAGLQVTIPALFDSILIALPNSRDDVEHQQQLAYELSDSAARHASDAFVLAQSGGNQEAINFHFEATVSDITDFINLFFDLFSNSLDINEDDKEAVINVARDGSLASSTSVVNGVYDAINTFAAANSNGGLNADDTANIKDSEEQALAGVLSVLEYQFGLLKTFYIYPRLNQPGTFSAVATNQYYLGYTYNRYTEDAYAVLFGVVVDYSKRLYEGYYDDKEIAFADSTAGIMNVIQGFMAAGMSTMNNFYVVNPDNTTELDELRETLDGDSMEADMAFLHAIQSAVEQKNGYKQAREEIDEYRYVAVSPVPESTTLIFRIVKNNRVWDDETEDDLAAHLEKAIYGADISASKFFDAVEMLAQHVDTRQVKSHDFGRYEIMQDEAFSAIANFLQAYSAAGLTVIKAANAERAY